MPSIFSRRQESPRAPRVDPSTSSNAAVAATSAFMQTSKSLTSLSSSAAAAALRSHTTSPEPVGSLQTKRMVRRGSTSSTGSGNGAGDGVGRPGLQRANSSGSMTERTFRSPSPGQRNGTMSPSSPASDVPPVPALPPNIHQRSSSLDPPQRIMSPTPQEGKRGSSADRTSMPPPGTSRHAKRLSNVSEAQEMEKAKNNPNSPSRNFSRPMSPTQNSPASTAAAKKYTHGTGSWFTQASTANTTARPRTSDGVPSYKPSAPPLDVPLASSKPVKKNRISSSPGSHLARANQSPARSSAGSSVVSYEEDDFVMVYDANSRTFIRQPKAQPKKAQPPSPESTKPAQVYDPNTRSFIPRAEASTRHPGTATVPSDPEPVLAPVQKPKATRPAIAAVDTTIAPPPKNPARFSSGSGSTSPSSPRAFGALQKQPSVVREDPEGEQQAEEASSPIQVEPRQTTRAAQSTTAPTKSYAAPITPHQRSSSLDVPRGAEAAGRGRNPSVSPQRSAHFSPSPILKPERHVPPPRDISPAKSALKHSPASSVRTASPVAMFSPPGTASTSTMSPPSETSEDTQSQDGMSSGKKKKSARVSFDEQPHEIELPGNSAPPRATPTVNEDEDDAIMKPRPTLPSFGSVRKNRAQPEFAEKVTEMPPERHEMSSDHAIGGILRNSLEPLPPEVTSKESAGYASDESSEMEVPAVASAANPEPATVGAGLEASREAGEPKVKDFAETAPTIHDAEQQPTEKADVPAINLLPPTPGIEDQSTKELGQEEESSDVPARPRNSMEIAVPGSWNQEDESEDKITAEDRAIKTDPATSEPASSETSRSTPDSAPTLTPTQSPEIHASPQQLSDIDEDSDDSAEFSDAVEDPSDLDDGGFASLDAIVDSPIVTAPSAEAKGNAKALPSEEPPESPSPKPITKKEDENEPAKSDWSQATSYWSQLSKEKREQMERQHLSSDDEPRPPPATVTVRKPKQKKPVSDARDLAVATMRAPKQSDTRKQSAPPPRQEPAQSSMRRSMRAQPGPAPVDDGVHMRRSMRSGGGGIASSLREGPPQRRPQSEYIEPRGALQKKNLRPMSSAGLASSSAGSAMQTSRPQSSEGAKSQESAFPTFPAKKAQPQPKVDPPQVSARLQRELAGTNDSDSESSFKKRRRAGSQSTVESQGRYTMRRSMRAGSIDQPPIPAEPRRPTSPETGGKNGFKLRSLSPPGGFFGRSKAENAPSTSGTRTTLRGPPASRDSGARRIGPAGKPAATSTPAPKSRFKSRFADSDDEDEDSRPTRSFFSSRFADSDDDEPTSPAVIPADLTPVRGIPRRQGQNDGDSTDLEDEDDEDPRKASRNRVKMQTPMVPDPADVEKAMAAARKNLGITEEPSGSPRQNTEGSALAKGSLRTKPEVEKAEPTPRPVDVNFAPPEKKKRGFMGSILRRNRNTSSSVQQLGQSSPAVAPASPAVATPASPQTVRQEPPSSPSANKLRRNSGQPLNQPKLRRGDSDMSAATAPLLTSTTGPAVSRNETDDWPLASPKPAVDDTTPTSADKERPSTSDGFSPEAIKLAQTMRPDLAPRSASGNLLDRKVRIQAGEEGSEPGEREPRAVYSRRTGKKKKFGGMRRFFGIDD